MRLAKFVNICVEELGGIRPPVDQLLQFKYVRFKDFREAKAASDLIHEKDNSVRFNILNNIDHAMLQLINPD